MTSTALGACLQASTGANVLFGTIRNCLRAAALRSRCPLVRVLLTQYHCPACSNWARTHLVWTRQQWARVVFNDESRFNLRAAAGRLRVLRQKAECFHISYIVEPDWFGGESVMVWGGISCLGAALLVTVSSSLTAIR